MPCDSLDDRVVAVRWPLVAVKYVDRKLASTDIVGKRQLGDEVLEAVIELLAAHERDLNELAKDFDSDLDRQDR